LTGEIDSVSKTSVVRNQGSVQNSSNVYCNTLSWETYRIIIIFWML